MQKNKPSAYWQQAASEDLENIIVFIAQDNPLAAFELEELAYQTADHIAFTPFIGRVGRIVGTREFVFHPNYILVYEPIIDGISILAVVHTRMNFPVTYHR